MPRVAEAGEPIRSAGSLQPPVDRPAGAVASIIPTDVVPEQVVSQKHVTATPVNLDGLVQSTSG
jgi:hypothetical protein